MTRPTLRTDPRREAPHNSAPSQEGRKSREIGIPHRSRDLHVKTLTNPSIKISCVAESLLPRGALGRRWEKNIISPMDVRRHEDYHTSLPIESRLGMGFIPANTMQIKPAEWPTYRAPASHPTHSHDELRLLAGSVAPGATPARTPGAGAHAQSTKATCVRLLFWRTQMERRGAEQRLAHTSFDLGNQRGLI